MLTARVTSDEACFDELRARVQPTRFGYPTGVGALVARRDALARLQRPWFAGGTVEYASVQLGTFRPRPGHDGFEDGTANFLGIDKGDFNVQHFSNSLGATVPVGAIRRRSGLPPVGRTSGG